MKTLMRMAIVAFAGFSVLTQAQAQDYTAKFNAARPKPDRLTQSMQYGKAMEKIRAIVPAGIPDFPQDPTNPQVAEVSYYGLGDLQAFHDYLHRALFTSGDTEGAIAYLKMAEEIAKKNADGDEGLVPKSDTNRRS
jgi:hypothetical protein